MMIVRHERIESPGLSISQKRGDGEKRSSTFNWKKKRVQDKWAWDTKIIVRWWSHCHFWPVSPLVVTKEKDRTNDSSCLSISLGHSSLSLLQSFILFVVLRVLFYVSFHWLVTMNGPLSFYLFSPHLLPRWKCPLPITFLCILSPSFLPIQSSFVVLALCSFSSLSRCSFSPRSSHLPSVFSTFRALHFPLLVSFLTVLSSFSRLFNRDSISISPSLQPNQWVSGTWDGKKSTVGRGKQRWVCSRVNLLLFLFNVSLSVHLRLNCLKWLSVCLSLHFLPHLRVSTGLYLFSPTDVKNCVWWNNFVFLNEGTVTQSWCWHDECPVSKIWVLRSGFSHDMYSKRKSDFYMTADYAVDFFLYAIIHPSLILSLLHVLDSQDSKKMKCVAWCVADWKGNHVPLDVFNEDGWSFVFRLSLTLLLTHA